MQNADAAPGKKIKLEVHANDAPVLREKGMEFFKALQGNTIAPDDQVLFGDVLIGVQATKPKGPVQISSKTAIKMSITNKAMTLTCPSCGKEQPQAQKLCAHCGNDLRVVVIS